MKNLLRLGFAMVLLGSVLGCGSEKERDINRNKDRPKASSERAEVRDPGDVRSAEIAAPSPAC
jgi:hypothetical protein